MSDGTRDTDDSVWTWGLTEFRDRTASDSPTPGGGSAAMVSAAIGVGLVLMALRVSARKADAAPSLGPLVESGDRLLAEVSAHADADIAAFEAYMAALRLPKATDEEKSARRAAMADAAIVATEVPLNAAQSVLEALDLARQSALAASAHIISDVAAGAFLLHGAIAAVLINVDINLSSIKDPAAREDYAGSRAHLKAAADARLADITEVIQDRMT